MAGIGDIPKIKGRKIAMASGGPMPGMAPKTIPINVPMKARTSDNSWNTSGMPLINESTIESFLSMRVRTVKIILPTEE